MLVNKQDMKYTLWFDVEERYKTIYQSQYETHQQLWFDVEERYKTIERLSSEDSRQLWFDVEERYKTITAGRIKEGP